MAIPTLIRIGHGSYSGANALRMCFSKAQAIRVLRFRGLTRNKARDCINEIMQRSDGYRTVSAGGEVIEICNQQYSIESGHFPSDLREIKAFWARFPEA